MLCGADVVEDVWLEKLFSYEQVVAGDVAGWLNKLVEDGWLLAGPVEMKVLNGKTQSVLYVLVRLQWVVGVEGGESVPVWWYLVRAVDQDRDAVVAEEWCQLARRNELLAWGRKPGRSVDVRASHFGVEPPGEGV